MQTNPKVPDRTQREQRILARGTELLTRFVTAGRADHSRYRRARRIWALEDDLQDAGLRLGPGEVTPQLPQLVTSIRNAVADMCDNQPEVMFLPEREGMEQVARDLTDIMGHTLEARNFPRTYRQVCEDKFVTGVGVYQIFWDETVEPGGGVDILRWPAEALYTDPAADDYAQGRAVFKLSRHPRSWFAQHYPGQAPLLGEELSVLTELAPDSTDEPMLHLVEYWYRSYEADTGRHRIHCAHFAGGVLLDESESAFPEGLYRHGEYPFVLDGYRLVQGRYLGMIDDLYPLQQAANRYARYEDRNARLSARQRFLVNEASGIDPAQVADADQEILPARSISETAIRQLRVAPLNPQITAAKQHYLEMIKEESGQNIFNRGETGGGVTAASAILALQEAGSKLTRSNLAVSAQAVARLAQQALWLMAQFFEPRRSFFITGNTGGAARMLAQARTVEITGEALAGGADHPPYLTRIRVQRSNPLQLEARNEMILSAAKLAQQGGTPLSPAMIFELINMTGEYDPLVRALKEAEGAAESQKEETDGEQL